MPTPETPPGFPPHPLSSPLLASFSFKPVGTTNHSGKQNVFIVDLLCEDLRDLINPDFKRWYIKRFYQLGKEKVMTLASIARADAIVDKRKLFSRLIKNA
jgi:hypothetical protein